MNEEPEQKPEQPLIEQLRAAIRKRFNIKIIADLEVIPSKELDEDQTWKSC